MPDSWFLQLSLPSSSFQVYFSHIKKLNKQKSELNFLQLDYNATINPFIDSCLKKQDGNYKIRQYLSGKYTILHQILILLLSAGKPLNLFMNARFLQNILFHLSLKISFGFPPCFHTGLGSRLLLPFLYISYFECLFLLF